MKKVKYLLVICLCIFVFSFVSCDANQIELESPQISLSGNVVSWAAVDNAQDYDVYLNDAFAKNVKTTSYTIEATQVGDYKVEVVSKTSLKGFKASPKSNSVTYELKATQLQAPVLELTNAVVSWTAIENATSYDVYINDELVQNVTLTTYTIDKKLVGEYLVKVVAKTTNTLYSSSEKSESVTYVVNPTKLSAPTLSSEGNKVSWEKVDNAESYDVYVNNEFVKNVTTCSYVLEETIVGTYEVKVVSKTTSKEFTDSDKSSSASCTILPTALSAPVISISENIVSWKSVENAESYDIYIDNEFVENVTALSYSITKTKVGTYKIEIVSNTDSLQYTKSPKSNSVDYIINKTVLQAPTLNLSSNTVSWTAVNNAESYEVYVNDVLADTITDTSYEITETKVGDYKVEVIAKTTSSEFSSSIKSESVTYTILPTPLVSPEIIISGNTISWQAVANASLYEIYINDVLASTQEELSYTITVTEVGKYTITCKAISDSDQYASSDQSDSVEYIIEPDLSKPVVLGVNQFAGKVLQFVSGENSNQTEYLKAGVDYNKDDTSSFLDSALQFIETTFTFSESSMNATKKWIVPENGKFYFIKATDGKFLAMQNGDLVSENGKWFVVKDVLDKENLLYVWQVIKSEKIGVYYLKNVGASMILNNAFGNNFYACADSDGHIHMYNFGESAHFEFTPRNIDGVEFSSNALTNLDGKTVNIGSLLKNAFYKYDITYTPTVSGSNEVANIKMGDTWSETPNLNSGYQFTFEKVESDEYTNAGLEVIENSYRIKNSYGSYLSFAAHGNLEGRAKNSDLTSAFGLCQIFIMKKVPGTVSYYRISNQYLGKWIDDFDGEMKYIVFKTNDTIADGIWNRQNVLQWDYSTDAIWKIQEATGETIYFDYEKPIIMFTLSSKLIPTFDDGKMIQGVSFDSATDYSNYAMQLIKVGDYYNIKLANGKYLTYKVVSGVDSFFAEIKDDTDSQLFVIEDTNGILKIKPKNNAGYLLCEDNNSGYHLYSDCNVDSQLWYVLNVDAEISEDAKPLPKLSAPQIIISDNVLSWEAVENASGYEVYEDNILVSTITETTYEINSTINGSHNYSVIAITDNESYDCSIKSNAIVYEVDIISRGVVLENKQFPGKVLQFMASTNTQSDEYLAAGVDYNAEDTSAFIDSALMFIETTFTYTGDSKNSTNNWIKESEGKFYYIKATDGKYLAVLNGDKVGENGKYFVSKGVLDEENELYKWQLIPTGEENIYYLKNIGACLILNNAYGGNKYICSDSDSHIHLYEFGGSNHFKFEVKAVNGATFLPDATHNLEGKTFNIGNKLTNSFYIYDSAYTADVSGSSDLAYIKKAETLTEESKDADGYTFTFEKVEDKEFTDAGLDIISNAYRIKNSAGLYLSFAANGSLEGRDKNTDLTSAFGTCQVFIIKDEAGVKNGYRIGNMYLGKWVDGLDGSTKYIVFQSHDTNADALWNRQNILEWDYSFNAIWLFKEVK